MALEIDQVLIEGLQLADAVDGQGVDIGGELIEDQDAMCRIDHILPPVAFQQEGGRGTKFSCCRRSLLPRSSPPASSSFSSRALKGSYTHRLPSEEVATAVGEKIFRRRRSTSDL